jgi:ABC-2 type transport system permease protein
MGAVLTIAKKDLLMVWRDKAGMFWLLGFPIIFASFFGSIFGGQGDGPAGTLPVAVIDEDESSLSRDLVAMLVSHEALRASTPTREEAEESVRRGNLSAFVVIEEGYGETLGFGREEGGGLEVGIDPSRRAEGAYLQGILMEMWFRVLMEQFTDLTLARQWIEEGREDLRAASDIDDEIRGLLLRLLDDFDALIESTAEDLSSDTVEWDGPPIKTAEITREQEGDTPHSSYEVFFPMALLWGIFGSVMASAMTLVKERICGTMLRLRVAPISRGQILAGKGLASFLTSLAVMTLLILVGNIAFDVRLSHPPKLALALSSTSLCFVGIMLLLASIGRTEEAAAGSATSILLILMMIGGGMVPRFVMPEWLQSISHISPFRWGILAIEGATWREFSSLEMLPACAILLGMGVVCFAAGVLMMRRLEP